MQTTHKPLYRSRPGSVPRPARPRSGRPLGGEHRIGLILLAACRPS